MGGSPYFVGALFASLVSHSITKPWEKAMSFILAYWNACKIAKRCEVGSWMYKGVTAWKRYINLRVVSIDGFKSYGNKWDHLKKMRREKNDTGEYVTFRWGAGRRDWSKVARLKDDVREAKRRFVQEWDSIQWCQCFCMVKMISEDWMFWVTLVWRIFRLLLRVK